MKYVYSRANDFGGSFDPAIFRAELAAVGLPAVVDVGFTGDDAEIYFADALTAPQLATLAAAVASHDATPSVDDDPNVIVPTSKAVATNTVQSASTVYVLAPGMVVAPSPGTYLAMFTGTVSHDTKDRRVFMALAVSGVVVSATERFFRRGQRDSAAPFTVVDVVAVGEGEQVEGRWRTDGGAGRLHGRSLILSKVGN